MTWHVFVGPTLPRDAVRQVFPEAVVHGPISLGDLARVSSGAGDGVVIIDGYFHQRPPVRHKEIVAQLAEGVPVVGAASMGALRAAELGNCGMIGIGQVYEWYASEVLIRDDEVAVAHAEADDGYRPLSVALVDIRHACGLAIRQGLCTVDSARAVVEAAATLPYTSRSWRRLEIEAKQSAPPHQATVRAVAALARDLGPQASLKTNDALLALRTVAEGPFTAAALPPWSTTGTWRTSYLDDWTAAHTGQEVDGIHVSRVAALGHVQLHDADFPRRWRRCVLDAIGASDTTTPRSAAGDRAEQALAEASRRGLATGSGQAREHWLTSDERVGLDWDEAALRILVRAGGVSLATIIATDERRFAELVGSDTGVPRRVAACLRTNAEVARLGVRTSIADIKENVLKDYLRSLWFPDTNPEEEHMIAAARDRAFIDLDAALSTARTFLLEARRSTPPLHRYR